jgi:enoyl-CoA hydratase/carnithine racemase
MFVTGQGHCSGLRPREHTASARPLHLGSGRIEARVVQDPPREPVVVGVGVVPTARGESVLDRHASGYGDSMVAVEVVVADVRDDPAAVRPGAIVVGVADDPPAALRAGTFDVLLTSAPGAARPWIECASVDGSIDALRSAVDASPAAALALVQVLRASETMVVEHAIVVESIAYSMLQHGAVFRSWLASRRTRPPHDAAEAPVRLERDGARLDIVLQRPAVHNAFNAVMRDALCDAFDLVALDPDISEARLRGDGPSFCSGGDLDEFGVATDAGAAHVLRVDRSVGRRVHHCADRVRVQLHGASIGAGIEIAAFAGRVVADPSTTIRLPEVAMGLIPGAGGTVGIARRIGRERAAWLGLLGADLDAATAAAWGLVDEVAARPSLTEARAAPRRGT